MKPSIKKLWVSALRSGKYKQGKGLLKTRQGKFCCLGVLCDLYTKKTKKGSWVLHSDGCPEFKSGKSYPEASTLPTAVQKWAGLDQDDPVINPNGRYSYAADNNDHGRSFKRIANLIEKNL